MGVLAQELQSLYPHAVCAQQQSSAASQSAVPGVLGLDHSALLYDVIGAVQALAKENVCAANAGVGGWWAREGGGREGWRPAAVLIHSSVA